MALNGFALGGAQQGFMDAANLQLNQQRTNQSYDLGTRALALQQQGQEMANQRAIMARADDARNQMLKLVSDTVTALKQSGVDDATIAQKIQPIVQPLKRLTKSSGLDDSNVDAMVATMLARPKTDISSLTGTPSASTSSPPATPATTAAAPAQSPPTFSQRFAGAPPAPVTDIGTPQNGGIPNLSSPNVTIGQPIAAPANDPNADVQKFTMALARLPADANPNVRAAITVRLQDAIQRARQNDNIEVKVIKDEADNQHVVFVDKKTKTVTGPNGEPFVLNSGNEDRDATDIAKATEAGLRPPTLVGMNRKGTAKRVNAIWARDGFNQTQALLEWESARKQVLSLNGPQMVKYAGLAHSVVNTIDEVKNLSQQLQLSGVPLANAAKLQAYVQTAGNTPQGQLVTRYLAAVNTLKEEFANLAQGGYAPTEAAWELANQQINGNYGVNQLDASLGEVQRLIRYRLNGIPNFNTLGPNAPNRYFGQQQPNQQAPAAAPADNGWKIERVQ